MFSVMKADRSGNLDISGYNKTPVKRSGFFHCFKLFGDHPNSSCYLKEGDFGWS